MESLGQDLSNPAYIGLIPGVIPTLHPLIAFSKEKIVKPVTKVYLCDNALPWTDSVKHVGNILSSKVNGLQQDINCKAAQYIQKANSLQQEFYFAHPKTPLT